MKKGKIIAAVLVILVLILGLAGCVDESSSSNSNSNSTTTTIHKETTARETTTTETATTQAPTEAPTEAANDYYAEPAGDSYYEPEQNNYVPDYGDGNSGGSSVTVPDEAWEGDNLVWVPVNGGTKYHSKSSCSNMIDPMQIPLDQAIACGYEPCKRCH